MEPEVIKFLERNRVCSLTTLLLDSTPHSAAVHYSNAIDAQGNVKLYFSVDTEQRKSQLLNVQSHSPASVAIGFSEEEWITLQLEGTVNVIKDATLIQQAQQIHYTKVPTSEKFKDYPTTIFLEFNISWWRYTDFNTDPITIYPQAHN